MTTSYVPSFVPPKSRGGDTNRRRESTSAPARATPRALSATEVPETESFTATITAMDLGARHSPIGGVISWLQPSEHAKTATKGARMSPQLDAKSSSLTGLQ